MTPRSILRAASWATFSLLSASACSAILEFGSYQYAGEGGGGSATTGSSTTTTEGSGASSSTGGGSAGGSGGVGGACANGMQDGMETDVDCGGPTCPGCANTKSCGMDSDCLSGYCNNGTCAPCTSNFQCGSQAWCDAGVCVPDKPIGDPCASNSECQSSQCEDNVCCDVNCSGTCRSCLGAKTGGTDGTCGFIPDNQDPDNECSGGDCNGAGQCDGCDMTPTAPGGTCPTACDSCSGTNNNVCHINCTNSQPCIGTVTCPSGFECDVSCTGSGACNNTNINCSSYACSVSCSGSEACKDADINCGAGSCAMSCGSGGDVCNDATLHCGPEICSCTETNGGPNVSCGSSCGCSPC